MERDWYGISDEHMTYEVTCYGKVYFSATIYKEDDAWLVWLSEQDAPSFGHAEFFTLAEAKRYVLNQADVCI